MACLALALAVGCGEDTTSSPGELSYWRTLSGAAGDAQDNLVRQFNKKHPEITVRAEFQGSYGDLATKLIAAAAAVCPVACLVVAALAPESSTTDGTGTATTTVRS